MPPGTKLFNADNGLRVFSGLVPGVPYKLKRPPEADQAETHAQTPRRSAALARAGMVRAAIRGTDVPPPERVLSGALAVRVIRTAKAS